MALIHQLFVKGFLGITIMQQQYLFCPLNFVTTSKRPLLQDSATPPVAATVFFGANDAALLGRTSERQHVPIEEYKENLRRIVYHLKVQNCITWKTLYVHYSELRS